MNIFNTEIFHLINEEEMTKLLYTISTLNKLMYLVNGFQWLLTSITEKIIADKRV